MTAIASPATSSRGIRDLPALVTASSSVFTPAMITS
jgi:hypothetical protein